MQVGPVRIILDELGPHFGNRDSVFGTCIRRRTLLDGDIIQGITEIPRSGPRAKSDPQGLNNPWLKLPSNIDGAHRGTII